MKQENSGSSEGCLMILKNKNFHKVKVMMEGLTIRVPLAL